jgi:tripartite ATP-independent transporter DctM subunit
MDILLVFGTLILLILLGIPVAFSMGLATLIAFTIHDSWGMIIVIAQRMYSGSTSFVLLAIPFYILSGLLMNGGGLTKQILRSAEMLVGRVPGGLGHVNVLVSMLFSGMSGSSVADASGMGVVEMEMMEKGGYDRKFSAAITAASATIGPIIPPSIPFVIYGALTGVSVGKLFLAGLIPGAFMGIALMVTVYILAVRRSYPRSDKHYTSKEKLIGLLNALVPLGSFFIIIGGISFGIFTPTEAAIVACVYGLVIGFLIYKDLTLKKLPSILTETIRGSIRVIFIIAVAAAYAYALTIMRVPQRLSSALVSVAEHPWLFLLAVNALLLLLGCFMETISIMTLVVPILLPIIRTIGIDPIHFGVLMTLNLMIGQLTPPMGVCLYSVASITNLSIKEIISELWPYILALFMVLLIITFVPSIVLFLPNLMQ